MRSRVCRRVRVHTDKLLSAITRQKQECCSVVMEVNTGWPPDADLHPAPLAAATVGAELHGRLQLRAEYLCRPAGAFGCFQNFVARDLSVRCERTLPRTRNASRR